MNTVTYFVKDTTTKKNVGKRRGKEEDVVQLEDETAHHHKVLK